MLGLVGNPENRFSHDEAHISQIKRCYQLCPPNRRGGDILFLVRIPSASASASASALLRFRALSFEPMDGF